MITIHTRERTWQPEEMAEVKALLTASGLPLAGLDQAADCLLLARHDQPGNLDKADRAPSSPLAGCAALEIVGASALLRSVAVTPAARGHGVGRQLVAAAEATARSRGLTTMYLLTESAVDYFPRLGYASVDRAQVDPAVAASVEFVSACPASAQAMRKRL